MNEAEILSVLQAGELGLPPLSFELVGAQARPTADAVVDVLWNSQRYRFVAEVKAHSTPKSFRAVILGAREAASPPETYPLVIVPYLSEEQIRELEREAVSGVDLSGNGIVVVPGRLLVSRTGQPNRFPEKSVLKNVYRRKVSIAARVFLLRPAYSAVNEIRDEILALGGSLAISTVSKVLQRLEEDLIVSRERSRIRLVQPEKLLETLAREYQPPPITRTFAGRARVPLERLSKELGSAAERVGLRLVLTGSSSVSQYAVMAREGLVSSYCSNVSRLTKRLERRLPLIEETERFPNVRLMETSEEIVYFDCRRKRGIPWASPIQTYLELMSGDKRDRENAAQIARRILSRVRVSRAR